MFRRTRMKRKSIFAFCAIGLCGVAALAIVLMTITSAAKRGKRPIVKPVQIAGIEYRVPNTVKSQGVVEAWQTNTLLWRKKVYHTLWVPLLEEDNQWNFIKSMSVGSSTNELVIINEEGAQFILNTVNRKVTRVNGSLLRGW